MSCKKDVSPGEAKLFAKVFVCPTCFTIAERFYAQGERQLRMLLVLLKEAIRVAILKGELQFMEGKLEQVDIPKEDLVSALARLAAEAREVTCPTSPQAPTEIPSREITQPDATTPDAGGRPSSG